MGDGRLKRTVCHEWFNTGGAPQRSEADAPQVRFHLLAIMTAGNRSRVGSCSVS